MSDSSNTSRYTIAVLFNVKQPIVLTTLQIHIQDSRNVVGNRINKRDS
jgi:hypothetical protein